METGNIIEWSGMSREKREELAMGKPWGEAEELTVTKKATRKIQESIFESL